MPTNFPGAIDNFTNPSHAAGDTLSSVPHDEQHTNANDAIEAIEQYLGINPQGTHDSVRERIESLEGSYSRGVPDPDKHFFGRSGEVVASGGGVTGDPFIVWDDAVSLWRMFYFTSAVSIECNHATAETLEGPWTHQGTFLTDYHKMCVLVDENGEPVQIEESYHGYVVFFDGTLDSKEIFHITASSLSGPWTLGSKVIAKGISGEPDAFACDAPYALWDGSTIYLWYMAHPDIADATYGLAQRVRVATASDPAGAFVKGDIVLNPSTTSGDWDFGWIGGIQIRKSDGSGYWIAFNAGNTRPGSAGSEPAPSLWGFARADTLDGTWEKDQDNPYGWVDDLPSDSVESTNLWRVHLAVHRRFNIWYAFYNTGSGGSEDITFARQGNLYYQNFPGSAGDLLTVTASEQDVPGTTLELPSGHYHITEIFNVGDLSGGTPGIDVDLKLKVDGVQILLVRRFTGNYAFQNDDVILDTFIYLPERAIVKTTAIVSSGSPTSSTRVRNGRFTVEQMVPK